MPRNIPKTDQGDTTGMRLIILKNSSDKYVEHHVMPEPFEPTAWVHKHSRRLKALSVSTVLDYEVDAEGHVPNGNTVYEQLLEDGMPIPVYTVTKH